LSIIIRLIHFTRINSKNEAGKYSTIVSRDENNVPDAIEAEHPCPIRNKIKTTFTFIKENNKITQVSFKRFRLF